MNDDETISGQEPSSLAQESHPTQPTSQQINFAALRKKLEAEEEARKVSERRVHELEQRLLNQASSSPTALGVEEEDILVDNEDYVQAKHIKTSTKKLNAKLASTVKEVADLKEKLAYVDAKIATESLKDFNQIVNDDNLKTFARLFPEDYQSMMSNPNLASRSKTAYNMIKRYGISTVDPSVEEKLESNKKKPQLASLASPQQPQTPLSHLNDYERRVMTEERRDEILKRVEQIKMRG
jgi:hypothetical protein